MSLAVLAALLLLGAGPAPPEARQLKEAGDRKRAAGDAEGAREAYLAAVAVFGGYAEAHEALGEVLLSEKRPVEAARAFEQAVEIEPGLALAWYNLGYTARRLGDLGRARDAWRRYLALRPEDLDARLGLAESLGGLGEREAALEAYQAFADLAQAAPEEARRVEKARQAMADLRAELAAAAPAAPPAPAPTAIPSATLLPPSGEGPSGSSGTTEGEGHQPSVSPATASVPSPSRPSGSTEGGGARPPAAVAAATPPPPPVIIVPVPAEIPGPSPAPTPPGAPRSGRQAAAQQKLRLGDRLLAEGDVRLSLFAYQDAVNQDPQSAEARLKLGRVYLRLEHLDEALEQFSVAAALDPGDAEARRLLEETRARLEGRAPPPGSPIIVRLPAGGALEPAPEPAPAAPPPASSP